MHNIVTKTKSETISEWFQLVNYTFDNSRRNVYHPLDMKSRHKRLRQNQRTINENTTKLYTSTRQFLSVEQPLEDHVWNALPLKWNQNGQKVKSMIVMKNPIVRVLSGNRDVIFKSKQLNNYFHSHSFFFRYLQCRM